MNTCFNCGRELKGNSGHVVACTTGKFDPADAKKLQIDHKIGFELTAEFLILKYLDEELSLPDLSKLLNISFSEITLVLDYFKIPRRNQKQSGKKRAEKTKSSLQEKFGVDNISQLDEIKKKKKETFTKNYGVDNIFKNLEFKKHRDEYMMSVYGKISITSPESKHTNLTDTQKEDLYGKMHKGFQRWLDQMSDDERNAYRRQCGINGVTGNTKISGLERRVQKILNSFSVEFVTQFQIGWNAFDFRLSNSNILIEVNGDYWHANPVVYQADDVVKLPGKSKLAKEVWAYDARKNGYAEKKGFTVIKIWEREIKFLSDEELETLLLEKIYEAGHFSS